MTRTDYALLTYDLESGYSRPEWEGKRKFRSMTFSEVEVLHGSFQAINNKGKVVTVRANGACKTWKRTPGKLQLPIKYGMYEYAYITFEDYLPTGIVPVVAL